MPKRPKLTEQELHAMIVRDARYRRGCIEFAPDFTLWKRAPSSGGGSGESTNWDVRSPLTAETWPSDCAEAFKEAVARARRTFDITWPL